MTRHLKAFALAASLAIVAGAAQSAPISYAYNLQPGELDFTINSTALNAQGFGTVDPGNGLLSLTLSIGGQVFQAASDLFFPTQPYITLLNSALSFAVFSPVNGAGTSYNFYATGGANRTMFDFSFIGSDGTALTGTGTLIPEPATMTVLVAGMLGIALMRRRT